jgi:hypothetical protein
MARHDAGNDSESRSVTVSGPKYSDFERQDSAPYIGSSFTTREYGTWFSAVLTSSTARFHLSVAHQVTAHWRPKGGG